MVEGKSLGNSTGTQVVEVKEEQKELPWNALTFVMKTALSQSVIHRKLKQLI